MRTRSSLHDLQAEPQLPLLPVSPIALGSGSVARVALSSAGLGPVALEGLERFIDRAGAAQDAVRVSD